MTPPPYFGTPYKRISIQRFASYASISLLAALAYHYFTARPGILAFLFPIFTAITAHFLLWTPCRLPISHCQSVSISSYLIGYAARDFHLHFKSTEIITMPPALVHFLLAFMIISDLEWVRLRFDLGDAQAMYPDLGQMCLTPRTVRYIFEETLTTTSMSFGRLLRGWRYILLDLIFVFAFVEIHGRLITGANAAFGVHCTIHSPDDIPFLLERAFWTEGWVWNELLMLPLTRPVRLFATLIVAWLDDVTRPYVDAWIGLDRRAYQIELPLENPPKEVAHIYH